MLLTPPLQFDTLICNKEKECEELSDKLSVKEDELAAQQQKIRQLQVSGNSRCC